MRPPEGDGGIDVVGPPPGRPRSADRDVGRIDGRDSLRTVVELDVGKTDVNASLDEDAHVGPLQDHVLDPRVLDVLQANPATSVPLVVVAADGGHVPDHEPRSGRLDRDRRIGRPGNVPASDDVRVGFGSRAAHDTVRGCEGRVGVDHDRPAGRVRSDRGRDRKEGGRREEDHQTDERKPRRGTPPPHAGSPWSVETMSVPVGRATGLRRRGSDFTIPIATSCG